MASLVALDTNVLAAAFLAPAGLSRRLLVLALLGEFQAIITTEVLAELDRHCRRGFKGRVPTDEQIMRFRVALHPLLEQMELLPGPVGRAASEGGQVINIDNRVVLREHPGGPGGKRLEVPSPREVLVGDMGDMHLLAAAIAYDCDYLCSWNTKDFPPGLRVGTLELITPESLVGLLENPG